MYATLDTSPGAQAAAAARSRLPRSGAAAGLVALLDQVCAEAGVWAPDAASRALVQAHGDIARAVTLVRVWAATLPDLALEAPTEADIHVVRRVSAAFQEVAGGQWLGDAPDLDHRLLDWADDTSASPFAPSEEMVGSAASPPIPTRAEVPRIAALLDSVPVEVPPSGVEGDDPTRVPLVFPAQRESVLAALARADAGRPSSPRPPSSTCTSPSATPVPAARARWPPCPAPRRRSWPTPTSAAAPAFGSATAPRSVASSAAASPLRCSTACCGRGPRAPRRSFSMVRR